MLRCVTLAVPAAERLRRHRTVLLPIAMLDLIAPQACRRARTGVPRVLAGPLSDMPLPLPHGMIGCMPRDREEVPGVAVHHGLRGYTEDAASAAAVFGNQDGGERFARVVELPLQSP